LRRIVIALLLFACHTTMASEIEPLNDDIFWLRGGFVPGQQPDGNSVILRGDKGLIVVDTGRHIEHTQRILDFARAQKLPITAIINTHWHLDHIGGNPLIKRNHPAAQVYASMAIKGAMDGFLAAYRKDLNTQIAASEDAETKAAWQAEIRIIDAGKTLFPDVAVKDSGNVTIDGRRLKLNLATHAVTEGDVWLYDRSTRTLIAGDLVTLPVPFLDTACPAGWQRALKSLQRVRFRTLLPGHGAPMSREDLKRYRAGFDRLLSCAASDSAPAQCGNGWIQSLGDLIPIDDQAFALDLLDYYISQVLRADPKQIAERCAL
jgi:glyoxylase-like metal-dependent hydrolase (beta-lactamase superfamily II)